MHKNAKNIFDLTGKVALVTGAGSGIGKAIAEAMGEAGAKVACSDINLKTVKETADYINGIGSNAIAIEVDVSKEDDIKIIMNEIENKFGGLDILFNVAGIAHLPAKLHEYSKEEFDRIISINLMGTFYCCKEALKIMTKQKSGKIINITSSLTDRNETGNSSGMAATKGAVKALTIDMAVGYGKLGIQVNAIAPGDCKTNIGAPLFPDMTYEEIAEKIFDFDEKRIPLGRIADPSDMKGAAIFLASKASDFVTGHVLFVDGGGMAKY